MTSSLPGRSVLVRGALLLLVATTLILTALRADAATAPRNTALPTVIGPTSVGKTLTAAPGTWSGTPAPTFTYRWQRCTVSTGACSDISGTAAGKATYALVSTDKGKRMRVKVTAKNSAGSKVAYSLSTATVTQSIVPSNTVAPTVTGTLIDGATLTAAPGTWAGSPTPTYTYQWQRCAAGTCAAMGASGPPYVLTPGAVGSGVAVLVTATTAVGSATKQSLPPGAVVATPPANTAVPSIVGTPTAGTALASSPGSWSGTPPVTFDYQWQRCDAAGQACTAIPGATTSTYTPGADDVAYRLMLSVTAANPGTLRSTATSEMSAAVGKAPAPPENAGPPSVESSTPTEGDTLYASPGSWVGASSMARQWQSCDTNGADCQDLADATDPTYVVQAADIDRTIVVREVATNALGNTLAVSAPTAVVAARPAANDPANPP